MSSAIPVIDLFAGPGGLSEGFSRHGEEDWSKLLSPQVGKDEPVSAKARFSVALSIEMDEFAHQTLELRALVRKLKVAGREELFYRFLQGKLSRDQLFSDAGNDGRHARDEAWRATLGQEDEKTLDSRVSNAVGGESRWVLIGGPPCQAYSLVGRSRNRGIKDYTPEDDHRHYLYREYLRIVAKHRPPVFVMENVKGLLSSQVGGGLIFEQIRRDLSRPAEAVYGRDSALSYSLFPVVAPSECAERGSQMELAGFGARDFIVRMECYGVPQARHRVILLGVRSDFIEKGKRPRVLVTREPVPVSRVLKDLPQLRSGLSRGRDGTQAWATAVMAVCKAKWLKEVEPEVRERIQAVVQNVRAPPADRGAEVVEFDGAPVYAHKWYRPNGFGLLVNHVTRGHIQADLHRYLFSAAYASVHKRAPTLSVFPGALLPLHDNAQQAIDEGGYFGDRFRVQVASRPSTTITSHISKDGHYYIHYDARQCRSLTVREAARLQTFPDDYFFCGPRTEQYRQVGNAVPPLLATQIAGIVADLLA
jgi:DNA (cytosine-5)-methyltransferase 1